MLTTAVTLTRFPDKNTEFLPPRAVKITKFLDVAEVVFYL